LGLNDQALAAFERAFQQMVADDDEPEAAKLALGRRGIEYLGESQPLASLGEEDNSLSAATESIDRFRNQSFSGRLRTP
jgi:hypothetical protein